MDRDAGPEGLGAPLSVPAMDCREVRTFVDGTAGGPIDGLALILARGLDKGLEGLSVVVDVLVRGVAFPDDAEVANCLVGDLLGDFDIH